MNSRLLELRFFIGPVVTSGCFVISSEHGRWLSTFEISYFTMGVPLTGINASVIFLGERLKLFARGFTLVLAGMLMTILVTLWKSRPSLKALTPAS